MNLQQAFDICIAKAELHKKKLCFPYQEPRECKDGRYYDNPLGERLDSQYNWMTSFVTGMAPIIYSVTKDKSWLDWADTFYDTYYNKISAYYTKSMHDLGFLYIAYAVKMLEVNDKSSEAYAKYFDIAYKAANELAKRFDVNGKFIDAWSDMNKPEKEHRLIIDSMMNIPLLLWAWKATGHTFYHDIALAHADTTIKALVRDDYSVKHAVFFDEDGNITGGANCCGYSDDSHWSRGTAWAVYGFAQVAEYTGEKKYFDLAVKLADKYLSCLDSNTLAPMWDFRLPKDKPAYECESEEHGGPEWDESDTANLDKARDSSAAAIIANAFLIMSKSPFVGDGKEKYERLAKDTATELTNKYFNTDTSIEGMLTNVGGKNSSSVYADYFYMLLLGKII